MYPVSLLRHAQPIRPPRRHARHLLRAGAIDILLVFCAVFLMAPPSLHASLGHGANAVRQSLVALGAPPRR